MISRNSRISKRQDQLTSEIDGKVVLLGVDSGKYFAFDAISTDVWTMIDSHAQVGDLCRALAEQYNADLETIETDVYALLSMLEENHLIVVRTQDELSAVKA